MKILFAGTPEVAAKTLQVLIDDPRFRQFEVVGVLTREDAPLGRKRVMTPSPVAAVAEAAGVATVKANRIDSETESEIRALGAELAVVIAYGVLLKQSTLDLLPNGWFNLHFSLLPELRGAAPVQRALIAGDKVTGVSLFKLDAGMDTGALAGVVATEVQPDETAGDLLMRLRTLGDTLLAECLPGIASGSLKLIPQSVEGVSLAPKLTRSDAALDFSRTAGELENLVRGCNPEPMAHTVLGDVSVRVLRARATNLGSMDLAPGSLFVSAKRLFVACGKGQLELLEVHPAGKNPMSASDWARGLSLPAKLGGSIE